MIGYIGFSGLWVMYSVAVLLWIMADKPGFRITPADRLFIISGPIAILTAAVFAIACATGKAAIKALDTIIIKDSGKHVE